MQIELPLMGTLANIIGLFCKSLVSGLVGAIIINLIDKFIAKNKKTDAQAATIEHGNQVIATQHQIQIVNEVLLERDKKKFRIIFREGTQQAGSIMRGAYENIMEKLLRIFLM